MIRLHLVGVTADLKGLIFAARRGSSRGSYVVPVDGRLKTALADIEELHSAPPAEPKRKAKASTGKAAAAQIIERVESQLSPKEIQRLLREGDSPAEVARQAGVGVEWIARFMGPVDMERAEVIGELHRAVAGKPRLGPSGAPIGLCVERNLKERRVRLSEDALAAAWSAHRKEGEGWTVTLTFPHRGKTVRAAWAYDRAKREAIPQDRFASDLGWLAPEETTEGAKAAGGGARKRAGAKAKPKAGTGSRAGRKTGAKPKPKTVARRVAAVRPAGVAVRRRAASGQAASAKPRRSAPTRHKVSEPAPRKRAAGATVVSQPPGRTQPEETTGKGARKGRATLPGVDILFSSHLPAKK
ncbi:MAG: septation protein SepH [Actinomycetota bacterium]